MLHELERSWIFMLVPALCHVQELGPGWFANPVLGRGFRGFEESLDGAVGRVLLVLDAIQPDLKLFPVGWFALLPNGSDFGRGEWFVLSLQVGGSPCGAHGGCCNKYCSVTDTQSARCLAGWLGMAS